MSEDPDYPDDMTSVSPPTYRWSREGFLRAHDAGAFDGRVELIHGEVWPVVIGDWHGDTVGRVFAALAATSVGTVTGSTLPSGDSLPDPDCWVRRKGSTATQRLGDRISVWDPNDVLLVVEVSDSTLIQDLNIKAKLYGSAGFPTYWVVAEDAVYEHTEPTADGYRVRVEHRAGDRVPLRYADTDIAVDDLITG